PDGAVLELQYAEAVVLALGPVAVELGAHLAINTPHRRAIEEPPAEGDAMAAHVHERAAARPAHVPEPGAMRARVAFTLLHQMDASEGPLLRHLLGLGVFRNEGQLLAIHKKHAVSPADIDHLLRLLEAEAERLLADDVLAGLRRGARDRR